MQARLADHDARSCAVCRAAGSFAARTACRGGAPPLERPDDLPSRGPGLFLLRALHLAAGAQGTPHTGS
jgi:hypothetical protein